MMNMTDTNQSETLLEDLGDDMIIDQGDVADVASPRAARFRK
jgi:flagellar motor switch protein FliN/FliY